MKIGEEFDSTCVTQKQSRYKWWMFWGSFSECQIGEYIFWERQLGKTLENSYTEHILPRVVYWIWRNPGPDGRPIRLMQDNAPPHKAVSSMSHLRSYDIEPIPWPAFSPDLNPIEAVWSMMKSYINARYPELGQGRRRSGSQVREIVEEAWESITPDQLRTLILSMPERCQAVKEADGGPTRY